MTTRQRTRLIPLIRRRKSSTGTMLLLLLLTLASLVGGCRKSVSTITVSTAPKPAPAVVRLGYFGNLTHAQAVLAVSSGELAGSVGPSTLDTKVFNAGPSLIEALLAGQIDIAYVGPGPALNAAVKTHGEGIRILSGSAANGVLIVAAKDSGINTMADLKGKRIATPQPGNTQDIAAKHYLTAELKQADVSNVLSFENSQQAGLMQRGEIDAAWAPEPWGSRLVAEASAHVVGEEKDLWPDKQFVLTLVVTTPQFLADHPDIVEKVLTVHHHWTQRLRQEPDKYIPQLEDALFAVNGKRLPRGVLASSIKTVTFTDDPLSKTLSTMAGWAFDLRFAPRPAQLDGLVDTSIIDRIKSGDSGPLK